ncbi:MAG: hypothetical protein ACOY46_08275 [Bacillota bacterium]
MKRILILALAIVAIAAIGGAGATLALFSSGTAANTNDFVAGTLEIDGTRDMGDGHPGPMFYINDDGGGTSPTYNETGFWAPGDEFRRTLQLENVGTLDGKIIYARASLVSGSSDLANILEVKITTDQDGAEVLASGTLSDFINGNMTFSSPVEIAPWDIANLYFWVKLPASAGNTYQSQSAVVSFTVYTEQLRNNP